MRILTFIGFFFLSSLAFGQIAFFHLYTNGGDDTAEGAVQLEDSSYVITGSSDNFPGGIGSQAFLMKIDSMGEPIWSKHYGGLELDQGKRVTYQPGFGFFIAGNTNSIGAGGYDFYLVKTDTDGVMEWEKAYGESEWERLYDAVLTRDTGMFMVGETLSNPTNNPDMYIVRTDKYGDTLWTKTFGGLGADGLRGVHRWDDSTFYVAGQTYVADSALTKAYIARIHEDGTMIWSDTIGPYGNYYINDVSVSDIDVYCVGYRNEPGVDGNDLYFMRHNYDGVHLGETVHPAFGDQRAYQATSYGTPDKRYVGWSFLDQWQTDGYNDLYISKMNYVFYPENTPLHLYYLGPDLINDLIPTSDGGALAVGQTNGEAIGVHHAYLCKIGPNELYADYNPPHTIFGLVLDVEEQEVINDHLSVYPNPTKGAINIESSVNDEVDVQIVNSLGQNLLSDSFTGKFTVDLSVFGAGVYFLKTSINGASNVRKVVVK